MGKRYDPFKDESLQAADGEELSPQAREAFLAECRLLGGAHRPPPAAVDTEDHAPDFPFLILPPGAGEDDEQLEALGPSAFVPPAMLPPSVMPPPVSSAPAAAPPAASRPKRRRYDWLMAAALLAEGVAPASIAERLGCSTEKLWRQMHDSSRFRILVEKAVERRRLQASFQLEVAASAALLAASAQGADAAQLRGLADLAQAGRVTIALPEDAAPESSLLGARLHRAGRRGKPTISARQRAKLLAEIAAMPTAEELRALHRRDFGALPRSLVPLAVAAVAAKRAEDEAGGNTSA